MNRLYGLMIAVLGSFAILSPVPAQAQVYDCPDGCTIVTCNQSTCSVWHCTGGGCTLQTTYPNPNAPRREN